jgi:hypothetical protein
VSDVAVAVQRKSAPIHAPPANQRLLALALAIAFVLGCRLLLYLWLPDQTSAFDPLYQAAANLIQGRSPYPLVTQEFPYPLPAVLLAVPFTAIPLGLARPVFDVLVGWAFVYALWRYRGAYAVLALVSGGYIAAMTSGHVTPLLVAASLIPPLGFLLAVKPTTSAALWIARPSWMAILGVSLFVIVSLAVLPSWPRDWWMALPPDTSRLMPPLLRPFGFILLLAALRWRLPEGRLIFATAFMPQTALPYELVALALIPANRLEMGIYVAGSWIAVAADRWLGQSAAEWTATGWAVTLCAVYLPMLYLVLRRPGGGSGPRIEKDRRRPHRLADHELEVYVTTDGAGGVIVKVTHLPTQLFITETGQTRQLAERKAQDRLAAIIAERSAFRSRTTGLK